MNKKYIVTSLLALLLWNANAQEITTENEIIDCGQVAFKSPVTAEFEMQNSGGRPLVIDDVRTGCGCTTVDYPQSPIPPGQKFMVKITYDAKQMGHFNKQIGIYGNGSKEPLMLSLRGVVVAEVVDFQGAVSYTHLTLPTTPYV